VSLLLGHSSVKITERHYAPFCKARQEQLAASVKLAWKKPTQPLQKKRVSSSKKHATRQDSNRVSKSA
jgi:integrase/recombinase XerD